MSEDNGEEYGIQIKSYIAGKFMVLNVQNTQLLYAVDIGEQYEKLGIYTFNHPPHRLQTKTFFKGMALLKNPIGFEMEKSQKEKDIDMKEFMRLYFAEKELECFINFPVSVLAVNEENFYRRYLVSTD